ncbi:MAG: class I SAM-dependent methyltransferase [Candidatus Zixiibacteriota bacterium]
MSYDNAYKKTSSYFGDDPTDILRDHYMKIDTSRRILDIGAGQGRNALFLARNGFAVDAIDPAAEGLRQIQEIATKESLKIETIVTGFREFTADNAPYSAILLFGIIQILSWPDIHDLIARINNWTQPDSLLFISAFSTADPAFAKGIKEHPSDGNNSYIIKNGERRTFLEPNEILTLFPNFTVIEHTEELGPMHNHGDGDEHRHGLIHFVGKKSKE